MSRIKVKWNKQEFAVDVDLNEQVSLLKSQLLSLSGVLPEKQKLMLKGKVLQDSQILSQAGIKENITIMMMGTATEFVEPKEEIKFMEDLTPQEKALAYKQSEGVPIPAGLVNLGNTCYMNSTLQCLRRVPELSQALGNYSLTNPNDLTQKLTHELKELFKNIELVGTAFTPFTFVHTLRTTFPLFDETDEEGRHKQQDAEECLTNVLETARTQLNMPNATGWSGNVIEDLFGIEFQTTIKCEESPEEPPQMMVEYSKKLMCIIDNEGQPVDHLPDGIRAGLEGFIEKQSESLGRNAQYKKTQRINRLPGYLVVQFVRFIWKRASSVAGTKDVKAKILRSVTFPKVLDTYEFCSDELKNSLNIGRDMEAQVRERELEESKEKPKEHKSGTAEFGTGLDTGHYQLVGVVTHKGRSADSGHYVGWAYVKDDIWMKYDDDFVTQVTTEDILNLRGGGDWHMAYLLLYRKMQFMPQE
ncbi:unnamed protein product [Blepharisma stoltei]|uniref:Ubiquitin carboxyl-terminal hydrolase n=1 Tax=Blepharisma stoltei TaxID=1481888 RepID=A0AAU9IQ12_9CILI|nr:unnamed protein product [Blepharisma stoltei]